MADQNKKTRPQKNKLEFVGWGSKRLIDFLDSIGKESRRYSPAEVEAIVKNYVTSNKLYSIKKKSILCDEKLSKFFSQKSITRGRVHKLLKLHFVENHDEGISEEEEKVCSLEKKDNVQCFAAVIPQNIRLIYLKRTLVLNLLNNNPESFENKVMGSIVRVSSQLSNIKIKKKHRFQLQQVTDIVRSYGLFLRLSNVVADVPISQLNDGNFTEEECEEFQEQVKGGWIKWPSFEELEFKANFLHRDITLHSIDKEIKLLQACMNNANEKGWGKEFFEYSNRIKKLFEREEQENRVSKMLVVVASSVEETVHKETPIAEEEEEVEDQEPKETLVGDSAKVKEEMEETTKLANNEKWVYEAASEMSGKGFQTCIGVDPNDAIWRGANGKGFIEGPTSLIQLWISYQLGYLDPDFWVWKIGQSQGKSVLLLDQLSKLSSQ